MSHYDGVNYATAWDSSITGIAGLIEEFINESDYPITYSEINTRASLHYALKDEETEILYYVINNTAVGFAIIQTDRSFHIEPFGYISKFYISPYYRKTRAAIALMQECVNWFDDNECVISFATATANIGSNEVFAKLLTKFQYKQNDTGVYIRSIK